MQISRILKRWLKVTRDLVAAKRLKHRRPEDVYFSRKEFHILEAVSGGPGVVKLLDYFESPAQSVIVTEYLEGKRSASDQKGGDSFCTFEDRNYQSPESNIRRLLSSVFRFYSLEK